jgi:hypothetical protein
LYAILESISEIAPSINNTLHIARFEVFMVVKAQLKVFWAEETETARSSTTMVSQHNTISHHNPKDLNLNAIHINL